MSRTSTLEMIRNFRDRRDAHEHIKDDAVHLQSQQAEEIISRLEEHGVVLLRDRPGAGKTVVSLAAAVSWALRDPQRRVAVVTPNIEVCGQWRSTFTQLWPAGARINPVESRFHFKTQRELLESEGSGGQPAYHLVVVDEAHRGLQSPGAQHQALQNLAQGARLLLVTATPFQLSTDGLIRMLTLGGRSLEFESHFREYGRAVNAVLHAWRKAGEQLDDPRLLQASQHLAAVRPGAWEGLESLSPSPMGDTKEPRSPQRLPVPASPEWLLAYHAARIVPELLDSTKSGDMFQRRLASSSEAFWCGKVGKALKEKTTKSPAARRFTESLKKALGSGTGHAKVRASVDWIKGQVGRRHHVLVFCVFQETQEALEQALKPMGVECAAPEDRAELKRFEDRFRKPPSSGNGPLVIIARDNLSESIDLDKGGASLLHHDLPWNPARLIQRWGRLVRRSSGFQLVPDDRHVVPLLPVEFDQRMAAVVTSRKHQVDLMVPGECSSADDADETVPWASLLSSPLQPAPANGGAGSSPE